MQPVRFSQIAGHQKSLEVLKRAVAEGRLHHSLLFHGPEGVGKRTTAIALAAALNCGARQGDDACGVCVSCRKIEKGIHPDLHYVTLEKTVIPIDAIRKLREEAAYRPFEGNRRVFIVDPADRMSADAQNALLKTLEEPSSTSCLVLVTSRLMHLLPTTRSRCAAIAFGTMPPSELAAHLAGTGARTGPDADKAARLSGGRYGAALALDLEEHEAHRDALLSVLGRLSEDHPRAHVLDDIEAFGEDAGGTARQLTILAGLVRDMMVLDSGAPETALIHADRRDDVSMLSARFAGRLDTMLDRVRLASSDIDRNVNRKLLLETLLFDLAACRVHR